MADEKVFADGFIFKKQEGAPDFVVGRLSVKVEDAIAFLKEHQKNGWVNLNIKYGRSGNAYTELDTFEPKAKSQQAESVNTQEVDTTEEDDDDVPF
jgi:hypothetical protein